METSIVVQNVSKNYQLYDNTKERILDLLNPGKYGEKFQALYDVNFTANVGEVVGFIGTNGSGKSTLSNIIAGIVPESSGTIKINGEVSLIAIAAGLNHELSGRDNIELKLLMMGFDKKEIKELESQIIEFSELEEFIDQPVKSYSSGMRSRLGFAISINVNPDILIIDEALSVGDRAFTEKSLNKMKEFKEDGKTMIFVSHSLRQMKQFCDKILWLEFGRVKKYGATDEVIPEYEEFLSIWKGLTKEQRQKYKYDVLNSKQKTLPLLQNIKMEDNKKSNDIYEEVLTSRIGKVKKHSLYYYKSIKAGNKNKFVNKQHKESAFYIKKRINYQNMSYYLLSYKPSATYGVLGWVQKKDLQIRLHIHIENDEKIFVIKGTGAGYDMPWGGTNNYIIKSLEPYQNHKFFVNKTERVGRIVWYYGKLGEYYLWINEKDVE